MFTCAYHDFVRFNQSTCSSVITYYCNPIMNAAEKN